MDTKWCVIELATASQPNTADHLVSREAMEMKIVHGWDEGQFSSWVLPICCILVVKFYPMRH